MNDQQFSARLDDLVSDRALLFGGSAEFVGAAQVSQVRPVLEQVEAATRAGHWAVGWVAYSADLTAAGWWNVVPTVALAGALSQALTASFNPAAWVSLLAWAVAATAGAVRWFRFDG